MEEILKFLQDELQLPDLKPKTSSTFEEIKIKYTDISLVGPESLRHNRRTLKQAMRRMAGLGELDKVQKLAGFPKPMAIIEIINSDKRYRQFKEIRIPSSNAVIIFARDWSGSMDEYRCDVVSDEAWWLDCWIRRFYKKVDRVFIGHDVAAKEVDENTFYKYRYGGGTKCSSAMKKIVSMFENRYKPETWNIYVFYFTDGENWPDDNKEFLNTVRDGMPPETVNLLGMTQVACNHYSTSLKSHMDKYLPNSATNVKTVSFGPESDNWGGARLEGQERDLAIMDAIRVLLGGKKKEAEEKVSA